MFKDAEGEVSIPKIVGWSVAGFIILILFFGTFGTIPAGEKGVKTRFSATTGQTLNPGLYIKFPFIEHVERMNTQVQKEQTEADAASQDLQTVKADVALNYHLDGNRVVEIYKTIGSNDVVKSKLLDPALQESVKAVTANYTAEQLITKRENVRNEIRDLVAQKLQNFGILTDGFNIVNFDFSPNFNQAIEAKVTAEQNALAAKNKLEQVKYEADQRVAEADGEAKAIAIQAQAIQNQGGTAYLQLKWIEAWKAGGSKVPAYIAGQGGNNFLLNIKD